MIYFPSYPSRWSGLVILALAIFIIPIKNEAQTVQGNISIEQGGQLWIEGSAGIINYQCRAQELSGAGEIENTQNPQSTHGDVHISVALPVTSLDCGKQAMNKDMYSALKSSSYPTIRYTLLYATLDEQPKSDSLSSWMNIRTKGIMEIAGVEDTTTITIQGKVLNDQRFQVKGSKPIHMDTYKIDPPTAMFGLIRASKELSVHFDVTVLLDEQVR